MLRQAAVLDALYKGEVTQECLASRLREAVEKADVAAALEHAAATGRSKDAIEVWHPLNLLLSFPMALRLSFSHVVVSVFRK